MENKETNIYPELLEEALKENGVSEEEMKEMIEVLTYSLIALL